MSSVAKLAQPLHEVLTTVARDQARRTGAIKRERKFDGATLCQTLVFGYLAHPHATLSELVQAATTCAVRISPQGLDYWLKGEAAQRLARWLQALLAAALEQSVAGEPRALPLLGRFAAVVVEDTSILTLPAEYAEDWPGCGGSPGASGAALKVAVRWNLTTGELDGPLLAPGKAHDGALAAGREALAAGSLYLADLGFFSLRRWADMARDGVFYLGRYLAGTTLTTADGRRWSASAFLAAQQTNLVDGRLTLGIADPLPCRLLAARVPPAVAAERRRKMRAEARRNGTTPTQERLALADWTILVTNVPEDRLTVEEALVLARVRWQIELLWKGWKSDGGLRRSQSSKPEHLLCELYAKLLALIVQHWTLLTAGFSILEQSVPKAAQVVREHAAQIMEAVFTGRGLAKVVAKIQRGLPPRGTVGRHGGRRSTYELLAACS